MTDEQRAIIDWVLAAGVVRAPNGSIVGDPPETADQWFARNVATVGEGEAARRAAAKAARWRAEWLAAQA